MFFIIQIHLFLLVVWWWIQYRWWKHNLKYDVIPVNLSSTFDLFESGDIILTRGEYQVWNHPSYYYALYCSISRTIFTHVGIILKDIDAGKLYVLHCSPRFRSYSDFFGNAPMPHAFTLHELSWYIKHCKGTSLVRRKLRNEIDLLDPTIEKEKSWELNQIGQSVCHEYKNNGYRFVKLWTIISRFFGWQYDTSKETHCAEFAGTVLKRMGLLPESLEEWSLIPDSFSIEKNPELPGWSGEYFLVK